MSKKSKSPSKTMPALGLKNQRKRRLHFFSRLKKTLKPLPFYLLTAAFFSAGIVIAYKVDIYRYLPFVKSAEPKPGQTAEKENKLQKPKVEGELLQLEASKAIKLKLVRDGDDIETVHIKPGLHELRFKQKLSLFFSNGDALRGRYNDQDLGYLARDASPKNLVFHKD